MATGKGEDLVQLAGRVQRLERANRRLQLGAGGLVAVLVAVPLVAAVLPVQVPDVISARAFRVVDEQGTQRATFNAMDGKGSLTLVGDQGERDVRVGLSETGLIFADEGELRGSFSGTGLMLYGERGTLPRVGLGLGGLVFSDEQGTPRASFIGGGEIGGVDHGRGASLSFDDEQGRLRAAFGVGGLSFEDEQGSSGLDYGALFFADENGTVFEGLPR